MVIGASDDWESNNDNLLMDRELVFWFHLIELGSVQLCTNSSWSGVALARWGVRVSDVMIKVQSSSLVW